MTLHLKDFLEEDRDYNLRSVAYQTVATFAGITKRRLFMQNGPVPRNDGVAIQIPMESDRMYQQLEHQLAHILFGTNVLARDSFTNRFASLAAKAAKRHDIDIYPEDVARLLYDLITILDSERVVGLWGQLYEGSETLIREHLVDSVYTETQNLQTNVGAALLAHHLGYEIQEDFQDLTPIFDEAFEKVRFKTFPAVLVASRWLLKKVIDRHIESNKNAEQSPEGKPVGGGSGDDKTGTGGDSGSGAEGGEGSGDGDDGSEGSSGGDPSDPQTRAQALQELAEGSKTQSSKSGPIDTNTPPKYPKNSDKDEAKEIADKALATSLEEEALNALIEEAGQEMADKLEELKASLGGNTVIKGDDFLRNKVKAKVVFRDVWPQDILEDEEVPLSQEDKNTASRLRSHFLRVMGRRRVELSDRGTEIDVESYIQQKIAHSTQPSFRAEGRQRGFRALILIDRSGSMEGARTRAAERACRVIQRALDFPFVTVDVWGFQSTMRGQVDIVRFHKDVSNFDSKKASVGGVTPLSQAMQVAEQRMKQGREQKHLFVITDGFPVYVLKGGQQVGTATLVRWTAEAVRDMRRSGVGVTGVIIGSSLKNELMTRMFGSRKDWRRVSTKDFGSELVSLVAKSFVSYLRHG